LLMLMLSGAAYFLDLSFMCGWIPPLERIVLGVVAGFGLLLYSIRFLRGPYRLAAECNDGTRRRTRLPCELGGDLGVPRSRHSAHGRVRRDGRRDVCAGVHRESRAVRADRAQGPDRRLSDADAVGRFPRPRGPGDVEDERAVGSDRVVRPDNGSIGLPVDSLVFVYRIP
jgi:hypothetical protein